MADDPQPSPDPETPTAALARLQTQDPTGYAAAVAEGMRLERERVVAHLDMGREAGAVQLAHRAIRGGATVAATSQDYLRAAVRTADQSARQADSDEAGAILDGADPAAEAGDVGDQVVAVMRENRGYVGREED